MNEQAPFLYSNPVRSALITNSGINQNTGGGIVSYNLLKALQKVSKVKYIFSTTRVKEMENVPAYSINPSDYGCKNDAFSMDYLAYHFLPSEPVDIVQTYGCPFGLTVEKLKRSDIKIIADVAPHNIELSKEEHQKAGYTYEYPHLTEDMLWGLYSRNLRESDVVIVHSMKSAQYIAEKARLNRFPEIIPHGCYLPDEVKPHPHILKPGYFGALSPDKGTMYLMQAWESYVGDAMLVTSNPDFKITAFQLGGIGSGAEPSSHFNNIGKVQNPSDFYNRINLYIQPSVTEGFGITPLEAMAHARPVIVTGA